MTEQTRWTVLKMALEKKELPVDYIVFWLDDIALESDDPNVASAQMYGDAHPEKDM